MLVCPHCGSESRKELYRDPLDPTEDRFECRKCLKGFGRYDPPTPQAEKQPFWKVANCQCGDKVLRNGKLFGTIHCWTENGCSVGLEHPFSLELEDDNIYYRILNVELTTAMYRGGGWSIESV